ncbi:MAG: type II toxin-antitoxin system VapC family toxin [Gammaproteobacteria bacterium]|nr:type II toxin-antitoxin system VapC family toxin [Gammaproteobacteria bacterium]
MIVADTNIISYFLLPAPYSDAADKLYRLDPNWAAPILWKSEFRSVLALYLRKKLISFEEALKLQESAESIMLHNEFDIASSQVLKLVERSACSSYDCEFVALAEHLNCPLVTEDKKIHEAFPSIAVSIEDYLSRQS